MRGTITTGRLSRGGRDCPTDRLDLTGLTVAPFVGGLNPFVKATCPFGRNDEVEYRSQANFEAVCSMSSIPTRFPVGTLSTDWSVLELGWNVMSVQFAVGPRQFASRNLLLLLVIAALIGGVSRLRAEVGKFATESAHVFSFRPKASMSRQPRPLSAPPRHFDQPVDATVVLVGIESVDDSASPPLPMGEWTPLRWDSCAASPQAVRQSHPAFIALCALRFFAVHRPPRETVAASAQLSSQQLSPTHDWELISCELSHETINRPVKW
jgi:hypothetical protein